MQVGAPYWKPEADGGGGGRWALAGVFALTLGTTAVSVGFNFLGRDFYNALQAKDAEDFTHQLQLYLAAMAGGIPVFVFRDYFQSRLALRWREWLTGRLTERYFTNRAFYAVQSRSLVDNPDQRLGDDVAVFTSTALGLTVTLLNSAVDLVSFAGILWGIYPPLFGALLVYAVGGTGASVLIGKNLVGLNFIQEKREADFRYGLVRLRENAESVAFYGGERSERRLLLDRFGALTGNYLQLLTATRNLDFFTSGYRYIIQLLPAAVVAPLYFRGDIEFGEINQSFSAFSHILGDVSLVVFQFNSLASFSAVIDRLGEFIDVVESVAAEGETEEGHAHAQARTTIAREVLSSDGDSDAAAPLLRLSGVGVVPPGMQATNGDAGSSYLVRDLSMAVAPGEHTLVVGPSGAGKTSLLRAISGLWREGEGTIASPAAAGIGEGAVKRNGGVFFVPQRPYLVLGSLRQQLLYPTWDLPDCGGDEACVAEETDLGVPSDAQLAAALERVGLAKLLDRYGLEDVTEWSSVLSLGEQQRLAFARLLLARPSLALLDESTSALDLASEREAYTALRETGASYVSVAHRESLLAFHERVLVVGDRKTRASNGETGGADGWRLLPADEYAHALAEEARLLEQAAAEAVAEL